MNARQSIAATMEQSAPSQKNWLKRLGWAGFLFFLIKGLVWLALFFGVGSLWSS